MYLPKWPKPLYSYFLFTVTEKCTCQSKWGECSLTSENSLFKLVWWPSAEYSKSLNAEWGIYEKRSYVVFHSEEALHSVEEESGNVDLFCSGAYTHLDKHAHIDVHMRTHPQPEKHRHNTAHSFFLLSHISHLNLGDVISNNYRWPLPVPSGCCLWVNRDNSRSQWRVRSRRKRER